MKLVLCEEDFFLDFVGSVFTHATYPLHKDAAFMAKFGAKISFLS